MISDSTVVALTPRRMNETDYDRERQRIRDLFGDSKSEASARWEQELATLFYRSGWTQEELARKEHKSQSYIAKSLRFGRFLEFSPSGTNNQFLPKNLTERRFRTYWEQTEKSDGGESRRFQEVVEMIEADAQDRATHSTVNPIGVAIREHYMDGKWHSPEAIARGIAQDLADVSKTLEHMIGRASKKYNAERKRHGAGYQYRIFPTEKAVSTLELTEKLVPLIAELKAEGRKNMATIAISRIAKIAAELQEFLDEWTR